MRSRWYLLSGTNILDNVGCRTLTCVQKYMPSLIKRASEAEKLVNQKTVRMVRNPEIEKRVIGFIAFIRQARILVNTITIIAEALNIRQQIGSKQCTSDMYAAL